MSVKLIAGTVKMPAGTYMVGDPCYSVPNARWMEWLESADYKNNYILMAELDGQMVLGFSTAYGDGEYCDQEGNKYPVDAGMIGLVPVDLIEGGPDADLGCVVTFTDDFLCTRSDAGLLEFGDIIINTDDEVEDDDYYSQGYDDYYAEGNDDPYEVEEE